MIGGRIAFFLCVVAAVYGKKIKLVEYLLTIKPGPDVVARTRALNQNVIHYAALGGDLACMVALKEAGVPQSEIIATDSAGLQPVHYAAQRGHTLVLDYLLLNGAQLDARDNKGRTALHWACYCKQAMTVQWLVRQGSDQSVCTVFSSSFFSPLSRSLLTALL